jgi:hypothetical protein
MLKVGRMLTAVLLVLAMAAPGSAAVNMAGTWNIDLTFAMPNSVTHGRSSFTLVLYQTDVSGLYSGTKLPTATEPAAEYMTLEMDTGNSFHFAISRAYPPGTEGDGYYTTTYGRGTASTNSVTGSFSNDMGYTGIFKGTR